MTEQLPAVRKNIRKISPNNTGKTKPAAGAGRRPWDKIRYSTAANVLFCVLVPLITGVLAEWVARGSLGAHKQGNGFFQALVKHFPSFLLAFLLLASIYVFVCHITASHAAATGTVGLLGYVPALVSWYKMNMRGEPFLPWDINQINDLMAVKSNLEFTIPAPAVVAGVLLVLLTVLAAFVRLPREEGKKPDRLSRFIIAASGLVSSLILVFGVFLNPGATAAVGIKEDMWMQDRYYRNHGLITGFLTNLQMLQVQTPEDYSTEAALAIAEDATQKAGDSEPYFENSYAATLIGGGVAQPDIIYVMAESFWDVTELPGVEYNQPITPNLDVLKQEAAHGYGFSPSFGGGTCDVEFEVLTGYSVENLPSGCKPYQQYTTQPLASLPQYLKEEGYTTLAIHGYGGKFWNRDMAYPNLGIDTFIASEDFVNPEKRRGFISDNAMVDRIIEEYEAAHEPVFIHAVTMQNHTTYSRDRYPAGELVKVTKSPATLPDSTIGQLEDCATGIREMDAALGKLTDYLRGSERPTIVVFWGDHLNPMSDGYKLFEETGFIGKGDTDSPRLRQVPLLIWSNYYDGEVDLGTISTYNIGAVTRDLYGLEQPVMFEFLMQQMPLLHGRTKGYTVQPDGVTITEEMTEAQAQAFNNHWILQYDYMFAETELEEYAASSSGGAGSHGEE